MKKMACDHRKDCPNANTCLVAVPHEFFTVCHSPRRCCFVDKKVMCEEVEDKENA